MKTPARCTIRILAAFAFVLAQANGIAESLAHAFLTRSFQSEDGLPSNLVRAVTQAADGYLWVGTAEGVARFDGVRFSGFGTEADSLLAQRPARSLFGLPHGDVWIATARGGLLRWDGAHLALVWEDADPAAGAGPIPQVIQVIGDGAGGVWIERGDELFRAGAGEVPRKAERSRELAAKLKDN